jgi:hypothetical protein
VTWRVGEHLIHFALSFCVSYYSTRHHGHRPQQLRGWKWKWEWEWARVARPCVYCGENKAGSLRGIRRLDSNGKYERSMQPATSPLAVLREILWSTNSPLPLREFLARVQRKYIIQYNNTTHETRHTKHNIANWRRAHAHGHCPLPIVSCPGACVYTYVYRVCIYMHRKKHATYYQDKKWKLCR